MPILMGPRTCRLLDSRQGPINADKLSHLPNRRPCWRHRGSWPFNSRLKLSQPLNNRLVTISPISRKRLLFVQFPIKNIIFKKNSNSAQTSYHPTPFIYISNTKFIIIGSFGQIWILKELDWIGYRVYWNGFWILIGFLCLDMDLNPLPRLEPSVWYISCTG